MLAPLPCRLRPISNQRLRVTDGPTITSSRSRKEDLPQGRTLFLANVPLRVGLDTAAYLREAFGRCVFGYNAV